MKKLKVYEYPKCSTCRKALKYLDDKKIPYEKFDITTTPPSLKALKMMSTHLGGEFRKLFNTSGLVYKEMKLSDRMSSMSETEALSLLASNGRLIKRPFILGDGLGVVGFRESDWDEII